MGRLGTRLVRLLVERGLKVRVLTRDHSRAAHLGGTGIEIVEGDVRDQVALERATSGVEHFVLVSVKDASPDHPAELMRMKYAAEQDLKGSGLTWTIIQPTAYMETWCDVLGRPLLDKGKTQVFGRGLNPINWVFVADVAEFVVLAATNPAMRAR